MTTLIPNNLPNKTIDQHPYYAEALAYLDTVDEINANAWHPFHEACYIPTRPLRAGECIEILMATHYDGGWQFWTDVMTWNEASWCQMYYDNIAMSRSYESVGPRRSYDTSAYPDA